MIETLAYGYSSDSSQREQSHEYQNDRVKMFFKNLCSLVLWMKVASALKGLPLHAERAPWQVPTGTFIHLLVELKFMNIFGILIKYFPKIIRVKKRHRNSEVVLLT